MLTNNIKSKLDTLMVSETKSDSTFPKNQSTAEGYVPPKIFDRNNRGGGIMLYILEDPIIFAKNVLKKIFLLNYIFAKRKYLRCSYNPAESNISYHFIIIEERV